MTDPGTVPADPSAREAEAIDRAAGLMTRLLRYGLLLALVILVGATVLVVVEDPAATSSRVTGAATLAGYLGLNGLAHGLLSGSPEAYLSVGVLVLVATPFARVLAGVYYFRVARDRPMVGISATVLALLLLSLFVLGPLLR